jgi:hypothetical protein
MSKGDTMINGRMPRSKTCMLFFPFSLIFCPTANSSLYHAPKKLSHEGVDHNSVVVGRVIDISILKERNDHTGGPFSRKSILYDSIENSFYVRCKELNPPL